MPIIGHHRSMCPIIAHVGINYMMIQGHVPAWYWLVMIGENAHFTRRMGSTNFNYVVIIVILYKFHRP